MARTSPQNLDFNSFVGGIITEASPLTFPPNATLDEQNFVLNRDGSRQRRLGLDFEDAFVKTNSSYDKESTTAKCDTYVWNSPSGLAGSIIVIHIGQYLYFYRLDYESVSPYKLQINNLGSIIDRYSMVLIAFDGTTSATTINGRFVIRCTDGRIRIFEYDLSTNRVVYKSNFVEPLVRDLWGVDDNMDVDKRIGILTDTHLYNLLNQGWDRNARCVTTESATSTTTANSWQYTKDKVGYYPANSDVMWMGRTTAGDVEAIGAYSPWLLDSIPSTSKEAPKGRFIIYALSRGVGRRSGAGTLSIPDDRSVGRVGRLASYAGRVFYSISATGSLLDGDARSPSVTSMIFFSQVGADYEKLEKCYSENDPTGEDINEPLATDGGFITIPEMGRVTSLVPFANSLFVIASNGVWEIHGGENTFSATNQSVSKVTNAGCDSSQSVVVSDSSLCFWGISGIYQITIDMASGRGVATNISQTTIQGLYDDITSVAKTSARGVYDSASRQFRWLYKTSTTLPTMAYDTELIYDLNLSAFYVNRFQELDAYSPYVMEYVPLPNTIFTVNAVNVVSNGNNVVSNGNSVIVNLSTVSESVRLSTKYLIMSQTSGQTTFRFTFADYNNTNYLDWYREDAVGKDAEAFMVTGYMTGGSSVLAKQGNYLVTHCRPTEEGFTSDINDNLTVIHPSSCMAQVRWGWTDSAGSNKWSTAFECYRLGRLYVPTGAGDLDTGFNVVTNKSRLRGTGPALSIKFSTSPGKDLHLYGWSLMGMSATTS